ncbi:sugar O-acetyltransferase [Knoellia sinensis KCTC 19936]|uniref:Sugar O-acetyltransferase n=1 Tax=Knoellia sinensis KCTC 19936 TaxID=1385520 RepID=A0A0A0JAE8_9MICO|nr:acetyltransferase [Knoellia sinensis]KGN32987.1 sugar O-acetyltransferase [Knoellia sinensis KCTC 19936]
MTDTPRGIVVVGAGGFGREVVALVLALRATGTDHALAGVVDDAPSEDNRARLARLGIELLGTVDDLARDCAGIPVAIAIGAADARRSIANRLAAAGATFPVLVHPDATVGADVKLGEGAIICPGARLSAQIEVGRHVHIDQNVAVGHDVVIEDFARLNPSSCVSGTVRLETGVLIGANATVLQGLAIGAGSLVGAGSVVTHDVPAGATAYGVPARVH